MRATILSKGWQLPFEGRAWLISTGLILGVGAFKNINLLTLLGSMLLVVVLINLPLAWWRLRRLTARRLLPEFVFAGDPCFVQVSVPATRLDPVVSLEGVRLEEGGPGGLVALQPVDPATDVAGSASVTGSRLGRRPRAIWRGQMILPTRGQHVWGPLIASTTFPFGLLRRCKQLAATEEVEVFPRIGGVHRGRLRRYLRGTDPRAEPSRNAPLLHRAAQAEFHGLREFRTGDSPRLIHWRTTARRGQMMVREFEDLVGDDLVLVLDAENEKTGQEFEDRVSLAASLCWEWCQHKGDRLTLGVRAGGIGASRYQVLEGLTSPELGRQMLSCLARVKPVVDNDEDRPEVKRDRSGLADARESPGAGALDWLEQLAAATPRSAGAILIGISPENLADQLHRHLERPVVCLSRIDELNFYTPPGVPN